MAEAKHPPPAIESANVLSYFSFNWIQPLLIKGWSQTIVETDLDQLSKNDHVKRITDRLLQEWTREVEKKEAKAAATGTKPGRPSLYLVLWRCFGFYFSISLFTGILESACKISEAILMGYVIRFFDQTGTPTSTGMAYAIGLFLVTLFHGTMHHHYFFPTMRTGMWVRQSLISLMYRKCLTLSTSSSISTGAVVNLISNDVQPFENATPFMLYAIIGPLEMIVVMYFLWREIEVACFSGLLVFALLMPIQTFFSRYFATIRSKTVNARDERIRTLSDVFQGIELVKLCAWEVPFQEKILMLRSIELKYIWKANLMRASNMAIYFFFQPLTALFVFVTYWLQGKTLTPDKVFVSLTLFNVMRLTMTSFFPKALETIAETRVSVRRITDFMLLPELKGIENEFKTTNLDGDSGSGKISNSIEKTLDPSVLLEMRDASFSWTVATSEKNEILELSAKEKREKEKKEQKEKKNGTYQDNSDNPATNTPKKAILNNITMSLRRDELLAIVGPVGCGKSSFCMALLEEMPLVSGAFALAKQQSGRVKMSYSAQSPWIFAGTIKSNILFGSRLDQERYNKVIKACELTRDLSLFPEGDETIIGEKGVTLSGGQRARVSLARAAYRDSDVYILDDPLSAVDPKVGRALFENCINGLLKDKARVLVTHQLQYIKDCENVIVLEQGRVTHTGRVDAVMQEEVEVEKVINDGESLRSVKTRAKFVDVLREFAKKRSEETEEEEPVDMLKADIKEETIKRVKSRAETVGSGLDADEEDVEKNLTMEEVQEGDTPLKVYYDFFRLGSSPFRLFLAIASLAAAQAIMVGGDFFLSHWSKSSMEEQRRSYYPTIFGVFCLSTVIMTLIRSYLFFYCVSESSRSIFEAMLNALLRTGIDFFHANPHGRVLNRFSKDMANCDELLPYTFFDATQIVFMLIGSVVVVCVVNPWIVIAIPFLFAGFIGLRSVYIKTSRQVKRIDSQTRSPIYSQLSETLDGLTSVRAFDAGERFMGRFVDAQEANGRAFFSYLICARWLGFRLDALSALFLGVTAVACVAVRDSQQAAMVGLALNYVTQLSGELQWAVRQSVEAAILMVSVERMMEYSQVKPEESDRRRFNPDGSSAVPNGWPMEAKVTFTDMSLTYPRGDGPVLKNITLDFKAGEKIGIVGRTGAGKSSLIGALFRLVETDTGNPPHRGGISIDGIDISQIGMHDLREKMAIIPQEPFLFRGTLRFNLDPISKHQDADIWAALEAAELKRMVEGLEGGLDAVVDDNGKNFSIGERQLLSLARAVLRRSKIIVMDEATANVDLQSDRMIQKAIHSQFQGATVFTIAHRLNTVIGDYDRILVLDQGRVMEIGEPWELLNGPVGEILASAENCTQAEAAAPKGWLRRMVADTGAENEAALRQVAKEQWEARHPHGV